MRVFKTQSLWSQQLRACALLANPGEVPPNPNVAELGGFGSIAAGWTNSGGLSKPAHVSRWNSRPSQTSLRPSFSRVVLGLSDIDPTRYEEAFWNVAPPG
jgi:hypothetical protein